MKKMFCRQLLACFCLVGVAFTSPAFAAYDGPKFSFRVAHTTPPGNHITLAFEKFKELVEKKSDGRISVQIFPNAMLGSDRVLMEGAQKGSLEMAVSSTPNMANFSPLYQIFDLPYITSPQNQEKLYAAIDSGELGKYLVKVAHDIALEPSHVRRVWLPEFCNESRSPFRASKTSRGSRYVLRIPPWKLKLRRPSA